VKIIATEFIINPNTPQAIIIVIMHNDFSMNVTGSMSPYPTVTLKFKKISLFFIKKKIIT
jgi:hypothetical protein